MQKTYQTCKPIFRQKVQTFNYVSYAQLTFDSECKQQAQLATKQTITEGLKQKVTFNNNVLKSFVLLRIFLMSKKVYKNFGRGKVFSDRKYVQLESVQVNYVVKTVRMQYCVYYEIYLNSLYYKPNKKRVKSIFVHISDFNYQVVSNILYSLEYFECQSLNDLSPCSSFVTFT